MFSLGGRRMRADILSLTVINRMKAILSPKSREGQMTAGRSQGLEVKGHNFCFIYSMCINGWDAQKLRKWCQNNFRVLCHRSIWRLRMQQHSPGGWNVHGVTQSQEHFLLEIEIITVFPSNWNLTFVTHECGACQLQAPKNSQQLTFPQCFAHGN